MANIGTGISAFSILITNVDDHLLNHGFLHVANGQWRLSPAFDINLFPDHLRAPKTWISEDAGPEARFDLLWASIAQFGIRKTLAKEILSDVVRAVAKWKSVAKQLGFTSKEVDSFANAFKLKSGEERLNYCDRPITGQSGATT